MITEFAIAFMAFFRLLCYQQTYYHRDEAFCRHIPVSACPAYGCGGGADELCALHHARPARSVLPIPLPPTAQTTLYATCIWMEQ